MLDRSPEGLDAQVETEPRIRRVRVRRLYRAVLWRVQALGLGGPFFMVESCRRGSVTLPEIGVGGSGKAAEDGNVCEWEF
jgi:hypothetical protein